MNFTTQHTLCFCAFWCTLEHPWSNSANYQQILTKLLGLRISRVVELMTLPFFLRCCFSCQYNPHDHSCGQLTTDLDTEQSFSCLTPWITRPRTYLPFSNRDSRPRTPFALWVFCFSIAWHQSCSILNIYRFRIPKQVWINPTSQHTFCTFVLSALLYLRAATFAANSQQILDIQQSCTFLTSWMQRLRTPICTFQIVNPTTLHTFFTYVFSGCEFPTSNTFFALLKSCRDLAQILHKCFSAVASCGSNRIQPSGGFGYQKNLRSSYFVNPTSCTSFALLH